jgi:kumamolisin
MPKNPKNPKNLSPQEVPEGYRRLEGSERRPAAGAKLLGPADANEQVSVTITLRRRPDGPPVRR